MKEAVKSSIGEEKLKKKKVTEIDLFKSHDVGKSKGDARHDKKFKGESNQAAGRRPSSGPEISVTLSNRIGSSDCNAKGSLAWLENGQNQRETGNTKNSKMKSSVISHKHVGKDAGVKVEKDSEQKGRKSKVKKLKEIKASKGSRSKSVDNIKLKTGDVKQGHITVNPVTSTPSLSSFKIPKSKAKPESKKNATSFEDESKEDEQEKQESSKRNRKELKEDIRKRVNNVQDTGEKYTKHDETVSRLKISEKCYLHKQAVAQSQEVCVRSQIDKREEVTVARSSSRNWVDAVVWSDHPIPDSTTNEDEEPAKRSRIADDDDDSDDNSSWKRKRRTKHEDL